MLTTLSMVFFFSSIIVFVTDRSSSHTLCSTKVFFCQCVHVNSHDFSSKTKSLAQISDFCWLVDLSLPNRSFWECLCGCTFLLTRCFKCIQHSVEINCVSLLSTITSFLLSALFLLIISWYTQAHSVSPYTGMRDPLSPSGLSAGMNASSYPFGPFSGAYSEHLYFLQLC